LAVFALRAENTVSRTSRLVQRLLAATVVGAAILAMAFDGNAADANIPDDGWRRTTEGWELWPQHPATITTRQAIPSTAPKPLAFPASAHPAAWAGLQLSLSLLALGFFPSSEEL
jgi:hypothetical protein